jgi:predicted transcriptional regulator
MPTLRTLRESKYLSRKALAKLADVSESTIVRMEEGKIHTQQEVVEKVLAALGVSMDEVEGLNIYNIMRDRRHRTKQQPST